MEVIKNSARIAIVTVSI